MAREAQQLTSRAAETVSDSRSQETVFYADDMPSRHVLRDYPLENVDFRQDGAHRFTIGSCSSTRRY